MLHNASRRETRAVAKRILLFTGAGKGKTTAALGMVLRASGHGLRVLVLQFLKADPAVGEVAALGALPGVELRQVGRGFAPAPDHPAYARHLEATRAGLALLRESLAEGRYGMVVADELCGAVALGLLDEADVLEALASAGPETVLVLTGRDATPGLLEIADTATEMHCLRHAHDEGAPPCNGVEQ